MPEIKTDRMHHQISCRIPASEYDALVRLAAATNARNLSDAMRKLLHSWMIHGESRPGCPLVYEIAALEAKMIELADRLGGLRELRRTHPNNEKVEEEAERCQYGIATPRQEGNVSPLGGGIHADK